MTASSDQILILNEDFEFQHKLVLDNNEKPLPISCSCISQTDDKKMVFKIIFNSDLLDFLLLLSTKKTF
jgi:hypothetical protein